MKIQAFKIDSKFTYYQMLLKLYHTHKTYQHFSFVDAQKLWYNQANESRKKVGEILSFSCGTFSLK